MWSSFWLTSAAFYVASAQTYTSYCRVGSSTAIPGPGGCLNGDVFLRGRYIEVGIHNVGSFGTSATAPIDYTYSGKQLGFIADMDKDGFAVGNPRFAGDYFVPGTPLEGPSLYLHFILLF